MLRKMEQKDRTMCAMAKKKKPGIFGNLEYLVWLRDRDKQRKWGREVGERKGIQREKEESKFALDFTKIQMKVKAMASCQPGEPDKRRATC